MPRAGLDPQTVTELALAVVDDGGARGWDDLTLAAVAARAGVAVPSLYKHVPGLPALRRRVALVCIDQLGSTLATARAGHAQPVAALRAMAHAARGMAHSHPGRYQAAQGSWERDPDAADLHAAAARAVEQISSTLHASGVPADRLVDAVRAFRAAVHGFVALELAGGFGLPDDVDRSYAFLVDRLAAGLVPATVSG